MLISGFVLAALLRSALLPQESAGAAVGPQLLVERKGPHDQARLGTTVAFLADLDRDERPDFLVGVPGARGVGRRTGEVWLVSGRSGETFYRQPGAGPFDEFGFSLAVLGDLDGDGVPDFAAGSPGAGRGSSRFGRVSIRSGRTGIEIAGVEGTSPREAFGRALCALGDLDGDGAPDWCASAPGWRDPDGAERGILRVYSAAGRRVLLELPGPASGTGYGTALAAAGDCDRDGLPDLAVGLPEAGPAGSVWILAGADGRTIRTLEGGSPGGRFGAALAPADDLNDDGVPDLAIGAPAAADGAGRVEVRSGADGSLLFAWDGAAGEEAGSALAAAGDVDGDGRPDLAVGCPGAAGGAGAFRLLSGTGSAVLGELPGRQAGDRFGAAVAAAGGGSGRLLTLAGAPGAAPRGPNSGDAFLHLWPASGAAPPALPAASSGPAPPPAAAVGPDFLFGRLPEGLARVAAADGRWVLYTSRPPEEARRLVELLRRAAGRLDEVLGGPALGAAAAVPGPVVLAFVGSAADQAAILTEVAALRPILTDWIARWGELPQVILWNPLLAVVRHDDTTALVQRPELQVVHHYIRTELVRRYGSLPGWLPEAVGYAIQDELTGEVHAAANRGWVDLDQDDPRRWREQASGRMIGPPPPEPAELFGSRVEPFDQQRAYARFGLGLWLLNDPRRPLAALCEALRASRPPSVLPEMDWQPAAEDQARLLEEALGPDWRQRAASFWRTVSLAGGPEARRRALLDALAAVGEELALADHRSRSRRIRLRAAIPGKRATAVLRRLDRILDRLADRTGCRLPDGEALELFAVPAQEDWALLCRRIAAGAPGLGGYLERATANGGFLLPGFPVAGSRADLGGGPWGEQILAHDAVHLWLRRACGELPLWLSEGIACAVEEEEFGTVRRVWNLDGFVFDAMLGAWPATAKDYLVGNGDTIRCWDWTGIPTGGEPRRVEKPRPTLADLYGYRATRYRDDLAHLAFGFAAYAMKADPKGLAAFLAALRTEYQENWRAAGRFEPNPDLTARLVTASFGPDFEERLRRWWRRH